jgi:RNA polymerase sigma-70 factor (ECF subfamily)
MNLSHIEELGVLKERCLQGDESAWKEMSRIMVPRAYNIGKYHFKLRDEIAADLAQDTIIKMVQNMATIQSLPSWVNRVMRNKCIDYMRKKKEYLSDEDRDIPDHSNNPSAIIERMELLSVLKDALEELPDRCRELIRLRFLEDRGHKEISQAMGLPYSQVPVNQARCLKKLKIQLENEHPQVFEWLEAL